MRSQREPRCRIIAEWTVTVILLLFGTATVAQPFVIPTVSMEDTLLVGDHIIVDKLAYAPAGSFSAKLLPYETIRRGDIIVFRPPHNLREPYVKRVTGIPGDRLRLRDKRLWLNGRPVEEPYVYHRSGFIDPYRDNFPSWPSAQIYPTGREMLEKHVAGGEVVVPPGYYFAMGDNRDLSLDSRYWGLVPRENIIGKPLIIFWSYDAPTQDLISPLISADHAKDLALHFFTKTRWKRSFRLIRGYRLGW